MNLTSRIIKKTLRYIKTHNEIIILIPIDELGLLFIRSDNNKGYAEVIQAMGKRK